MEVDDEIASSEGGEGTSSSSTTTADVPWPALQPFFKKIGSKDDQNIVAKCLFCKKNYSSSLRSKANLEKHLVSKKLDAVSHKLFVLKRACFKNGKLITCNMT